MGGAAGPIQIGPQPKETQTRCFIATETMEIALRRRVFRLIVNSSEDNRRLVEICSCSRNVLQVTETLREQDWLPDELRHSDNDLNPREN